MSDTELSRRSVLQGGALVAVAGVAGFAVARRSDAAEDPPDAAADPYGAAPAAANAYGAPPPPTGDRLAALEALPAGGGLVLPKRRLVLTRDAKGIVRAFSSVCTHQGCPVTEVKAGMITCPCHGSLFDAATGAVARGPAKLPLRAVPVVVRGGMVFTK
jgi:Rieske Fe-S protein